MGPVGHHLGFFASGLALTMSWSRGAPGPGVKPHPPSPRHASAPSFPAHAVREIAALHAGTTPAAWLRAHPGDRLERFELRLAEDDRRWCARTPAPGRSMPMLPRTERPHRRPGARPSDTAGKGLRSTPAPSTPAPHGSKAGACSRASGPRRLISSACTTERPGQREPSSLDARPRAARAPRRRVWRLRLVAQGRTNASTRTMVQWVVDAWRIRLASWYAGSL